MAQNTFLRDLFQFLLGPIGNLWRMQQYLGGKNSEDVEVGFNSLTDDAISVVRSKLGLQPSRADDINYQRQQDLIKNKYVLESQGMEEAGLNKALMYGGGSMPSSSSVPSGYASNLSDLIALVTLPQQMQLLNAQSKDIAASAKLKAAQTDTQYTITELNRITAEWMPELNAGQLTKWKSEVDNAYSDINYKVAMTDKVKSEKDAQDILNQYLERKQRLELFRLSSEIKDLDASVRASNAKAFYDEVLGNFADKNGFMMSSNDALLIATYIADIFGYEKKDADEIVEQLIDHIPLVKAAKIGGEIYRSHHRPQGFAVGGGSR